MQSWIQDHADGTKGASRRTNQDLVVLRAPCLRRSPPLQLLLAPQRPASASNQRGGRTCSECHSEAEQSSSTWLLQLETMKELIRSNHIGCNGKPETSSTPSTAATAMQTKSKRWLQLLRTLGWCRTVPANLCAPFHPSPHLQERTVRFCRLCLGVTETQVSHKPSLRETQSTSLFKTVLFRPWLVWLSGLSAGLWTKGSQVRFPVRAYAWVAGLVPSSGHARGNHNHTLMFLSLSFSFPSLLSKNK